MPERYSRQILFLGEEGQEKLQRSSIAIIGCGALGTVIASTLVRAGVGRIRIIDRDFIEYHNLHRQILFNEDDIKKGLPKAIAAERHLRRINSEIEIEGVVADVNYTNIENLVSGIDLVLDALDNFETRLLINDVALKHKIPWIYGGVISSLGMTKNFFPGETPCFRCTVPNLPEPGTVATCDTAGVLNTAPFIIGSLQATAAIKILIRGEKIDHDLVVVDVWTREFWRTPDGGFRKDCPACQGRYEFLERKYGMRTTSLCGQNAVQVINPEIKKISLEQLASKLKSVGEVNTNEFMLRFNVDQHEMVIFPDGRAIIKNTHDESEAKGLYAKYIGM
jgi:molybdopterin-synthase adenylyltransferase